MPHYRQRERRKHQQRWCAALAHCLAGTRRTLGLTSDQIIPDLVLRGEAEHHFAPPGLAAPSQWFGLRLMRMADSDAELDDLLAHLRASRLGPVPWGVNAGAKSPHRSRRAPHDLGVTTTSDSLDARSQISHSYREP